jgi:endonuclease/exonuclease/phosphatase family metal-dependent hydrolase
MELKVMNYNILHGFHSENHELEPYRLKVAQKIVAAENPDILVLTEACYGDQNTKWTRMNYGELFHFPHYSFFKRGDYEWGSALLSKHPITEIVNNKRGMHHRVRTTIDLAGAPLTVDIAHPHPALSEEDKANYFRDIVTSAPKNKYVLAGDFNAWSPQDIYERDKLVRGFTGGEGRDMEAAAKIVDDALRCKAIQTIIDAWLVDSYRKLHPNGFAYTNPTPLAPNENARLRLDYIFCSPDFTVKDATIIQNAETDKASNHCNDNSLKSQQFL